MGNNGGTSKVVKRSGAQCCADETEAGAGNGRIPVLQSVPPSIDFSKNCASNVIPICLCILHAGDGEVLRFPADRPASFRDPDGLAS